jgi:hypothetical protein
MHTDRGGSAEDDTDYSEDKLGQGKTSKLTAGSFVGCFGGSGAGLFPKRQYR